MPMDIKKTLVGSSVTAIMLLSLLAPMLLVQPSFSSPGPEYMTINGVLATDTYVLYPYRVDRNLRIGFSKYGEMIDGNTNVGLEYAGVVDPFANDRVLKTWWIQGWLINITYYNMEERRDRNVWACALFADTRAWGGPWLRVDFENDYDDVYGFEDPRDPGYVIGASPYPGTLRSGGRKTNGTAVTEDIRVLYDGPRRFVAQLETTIYDHPLYRNDSRAADIPLVRLTFTIIFNKVKKQVIILKDVKSLLESKYGHGLRIQFSNRGEVDLGLQVGTPTSYLSNAYFWTEDTQDDLDPLADGWPTLYNADWELSQTDDLGPGGSWTLSYGYPQTAVPATFDVAMAINPAIRYVWWAAFWPSLSDYTIDGWDMWWRSMMEDDPHDTSKRVAEESVPFYIGEWDFRLDIVDAPAPSEGVQFRCVTVYGLTDLHDGELVDNDNDCNFTDAGDIRTPDREMIYQLDEVFYPWDLWGAVHKQTSRKVIFDTGPTITFNEPDFWYIDDEDWDQYCFFSERVIDLTENELEAREDYAWRPGQDTYTISFDPATGNVTIEGLDDGHEYKILYSVFSGRYEWIVVGRDAETVDSAGAALISEAFDSLKNIEVGIAGADMRETQVWNAMPWVMHRFGAGNAKADYYYSAADRRTALKDDWCTYWPISSSNMIAVGGPLANMLAYYFNDFTEAFFGLPEFAAGSIWSNRVVALTCWRKNSYSSNEAVGYAVIATYKDINGTVGFLVWGHWGRDTYYASQWLWGDSERGIEPGIIQLQDAPDGATAIILEIDYEDPEHPTFSVVEVLGTISETLWTHDDIEKGGIHDP